jgi:HAD superfamily hydrolase (TIGR01549 family)
VGHPDARRSGSPVEAVLLDAYGTLVELRDPGARLRDRLAAEGHPHPADRVEAALAGEIRFYRRHHDRGRDAASLAALRLDCARALAEGLGPDVPPLARLADILVESLRFELLPDVLPALDDLATAGLRLAVVSNWDVGLGAVLAGLGVAERFEAVAVSAVVGVGKPDPAIFAHALSLLRVTPARAIHCGDHPEYDCAGAQGAGVRGILIDRSDAHPEAPCPRVRSLVELRHLIGLLED